MLTSSGRSVVNIAFLGMFATLSLYAKVTSVVAFMVCMNQKTIETARNIRNTRRLRLIFTNRNLLIITLEKSVIMMFPL